jgi:hypothetical protein
VGINAMDPPPYARRLHRARMISGLCEIIL